MTASLLIELLTEELPPRFASRGQFIDVLLRELHGHGLIKTQEARWFATPRRLGALIPNVDSVETARVEKKLGPRIAQGYDALGNPTPALRGFVNGLGISMAEFESNVTRNADAKGDRYAYAVKHEPRPLAALLPAIMHKALATFPIAKPMRWGNGDAQFVRPVHGLIMLHGSDVIPGELFGVSSGACTNGHRFMSDGPIVLATADSYESVLQEQGKVIADPIKRRVIIQDALQQAAAGAHVVANDALIDEVTDLVEYPAVYTGTFSADFLAVPEECLIIAMQKQQRYFPLRDTAGALLPKFLFVSNIATDRPEHIIHGNERVLRARLSDAKFFYDQDRKTPLSARVPRLDEVVYHHKLGSQGTRVRRLQQLAQHIARKLDADADAALRAAILCKADLLTDMVGEFPELQGIMGKYYAAHDGEPEAVATAIAEHYQPRYAGDALPCGEIACALALADKLDTLVGIAGIGMLPSGDKDPFGLRRQALGVLRILIDRKLPLDLHELLQAAHAAFADGLIAVETLTPLYAFMLDRLKPYLRDNGFLADEIDAVLSQKPTRMDTMMQQLDALQQFRCLPEAQALSAANKRIRNILRQAGFDVMPRIDPALFQDTAEQSLAEELENLRGPVQRLFESGDYSLALKRLAGLRAPIDAFFDQVMVMVDEAAVRNNRLALLQEVNQLFLRAADISRLQ